MDTVRFIVNGQVFVPPVDKKHASAVARLVCKLADIKERKA